MFKDDFRNFASLILFNSSIDKSRSLTVASRSVCIDRLYYNKDKTLKRIIMTSEGVPTLKK